MTQTACSAVSVIASFGFRICIRFRICTEMWRSRMFWRLFATYGLLLLAAIVGLGVVVLGRVERYHREQLNDRLRIKAFLVRELVRAHADQPLSDLDASLKRLRPDGLPRVTLV